MAKREGSNQLQTAIAGVKPASGMADEEGSLKIICEWLFTHRDAVGQSVQEEFARRD